MMAGQKRSFQSGEMTPWANMPAAKTDNLSSILWTHVVEGEQTLTSCPLTSTCTPWLLHALGKKRTPIHANSLPSHRLRAWAPPKTSECHLCFQALGLTSHTPPHEGLPNLARPQITLATLKTAGL